MKRTNYLLTRSERLIGVALPGTVATRLRGPLAALAGALALVAALHGVQSVRLANAAHEGAVAADRLATTQLAVARVRAVENDVVRLRGLVRRVAEIQRSGAARASALAAIGNGLPADAWLSSIRAEPGGYALEGRGARLATVGTAMASLGRLPATTGERLIGVHDDADHTGVSYTLALETRR